MGLCWVLGVGLGFIVSCRSDLLSLVLVLTNPKRHRSKWANDNNETMPFWIGQQNNINSEWFLQTLYESTLAKRDLTLTMTLALNLALFLTLILTLPLTLTLTPSPNS